MTKSSRAATVVAVLSTVLILLLSTSTLAASPIIDAGQQKGRSADAWTGSCVTDPDTGDRTCRNASAWVLTGWSRLNGERSREPRACVSVGQSEYDSSEDIWYDSYEYGCADDGSAVVARDLRSASGSGTAQTTLEECVDDGDDYVCEDGPGREISFAVEWTGDGPLNRGSYRYTDRTGDCRSTDSGNGTSRSGTATGTIDGQDLDFEEAYLNDGSYKYTYVCKH
jgi:hypothetical protein